MSKTIAEISVELIEANKTVKPIQDAFNAKINEVFATIKKFNRSHKFYDSKYSWIEDMGYFTLHAENITEDGIYFEYLSMGGSLEEESLTFDEMDNIEAYLEANYNESVTARAAEEEKARVAELAALNARVAELTAK